MNGDPIARLPINNRESLDPHDQAVVQHLFSNKLANVDSGAVAKFIKTPLLVAVLVGTFSLPQVDRIIDSIFPSAKDSVYYKIMIKMVVSAVLFYVLNNWALARK